MQARGVSLWLTPEGPEAQALGAIVSELSCRFGTPAFTPHVTLMAGLALHPEAVVGRCRELARGLHPFSLRFLGVQRGADYFRTLFVLASPDLPILDARQRAESLFAAHPRESFMPHLSLLYGALPTETLRLLAEEVSASSPPSLLLQTLEVVSTEGPVSAWRSLARLPLGGR
ncbi:MAG: 2'-5' RNA ligase family protein [Vicinamibacteria bacterium]